jgi:hypothetical protein
MVVAAAFLLRIPAIGEPLGIDQGLLASGARALARGQVLYRDVWDQKPPAIFLTYLAAFSLFGWTPSSVAWLDIVTVAATTILLFSIVRSLGGAMMGTIAVAVYATLTMPGWLYRYGGFLERSVAETFITFFVALAAWCAVHVGRSRAGNVAAAGMGLAAGIAVSFKPNAALYLPALLIWIAVAAIGRTASASIAAVMDVRRFLKIVVISGLASLVIPALMLAWLWGHGVMSDAKIALIDFNRFYVAENFSLGSFAVDFSKAVWLRIKTDPLWAAGSIAAVAAAWELVRAKRLEPVPALAILWGAAAAAVIFVNGVRLYNTYFIQVLAPLAVLASWLFATASQRPLPHKALALTAAIVVAGLLARKNFPSKVYEIASADVAALTGHADRVTYLDRFGGYATGRGYSARANDELAGYIRTRTTSGDLIYQFGINSAGLYFASDRRQAQRFLRVNEFVPAVFPAPGFDLASVTQELASRKPIYLVFEELHTGTEMANAVDRLQEAPEIKALLEPYQLETRIEDFTVYRRK